MLWSVLKINVMKHILYILLCLFVYNCQSSQKADIAPIEKTDSIFSIGATKKLYMNDLDYPTSGHIRYYEKDGKAYLIQGNEKQKMIRLYDYHSGEKVFDADIKDINGEFFAYNTDTAFIISGKRNKATIYEWTKGEIKETEISVSVKKGDVEQYPRCRWNGGVLVEGKWYFSCYRLGEYPDEMKSGKERFPLLEFDSNNNRSRFVGEYPDMYAHNNMGTLNYWVPELCRGVGNGEILVGFKASPDILVYSPATGNSRFESVKSIYADTIPLPLTEKGRTFFQESASYYYYAQYSHYGAISYDPWRKLYYRFVGIGLYDWDLEPSPLLQNRKSWSVMVFDTSFRKLGEQYLGKDYNVNYHFVSPEGLYVLKDDKNENVANYSLLNYIGN